MGSFPRADRESGSAAEAGPLALGDYLQLLRRHALLIVLATALGAGGAVVATAQQAEVFSTTTQLLVSVSGTDSGGQAISRRPVAVQAATVLSELASTPPAVAAARLQAQLGPGQGGAVTAQADGASPFVLLTVTGGDPAIIARLANAFATTLPGVAATLDQIDQGDRVQLKALSPAPVNPIPTSPRPRRNLLAGLVLGLLVGLAGAFGRSALDRQLRDSGDIEAATGLPVLGAVPSELEKERLPAVSHPGSVRAEAYRLVRTNMQFMDVVGVPRTLLVTSASPGDGKTSLAVNLAVSFAQAGERVVVVDADLRKPRVAYHFGIDGVVGLSDVLAPEPGDMGRFTQTAADGLVCVLPSGRTPANPSELVGSPAMARTLAWLAERYDRVIVDAPPVLPVADSVKLAGMVGGVVLVARMGRTTLDELKAAQRRLEVGSVRILGVVANGVHPSRDQAYGYGGSKDYVYAGQPSRRSERRRRRDVA